MSKLSQIEQKIKEACPWLKVPAQFDLYKEPQLSDLLYTIGKVDAFCCYTQSNGTLCIQQESDEKKWCNYDTTKSVRENLENEELCDFIHQLICK